MSLAAVRAALETALAAISPAIDYAWENVDYSPVVGTPYAQVYLLTATPDNREIGPGYTEQGFLQVNLFYPIGNGPADASARAALIRAAFPFGATFAAGSDTVLIKATPEVGPARTEDDRYLLPVRIRFEAHIGGTS